MSGTVVQHRLSLRFASPFGDMLCTSDNLERYVKDFLWRCGMEKKIVEAYENYVSVKSILRKDRNGNYEIQDVKDDFRTFRKGYLSALKIHHITRNR